MNFQGLDYLLHEGNPAACLSCFEHLYCTRHAGKLRAVFCCKVGMYKFALHVTIRKIRADETMKAFLPAHHTGRRHQLHLNCYGGVKF